MKDIHPPVMIEFWTIFVGSNEKNSRTSKLASEKKVSRFDPNIDQKSFVIISLKTSLKE